MKFTKISLVAAMLIGSSAFAIENTKVSGDANLNYYTNDATGADIFDKANSAADVAINLNLTTDLLKTDTVSVSAGAGYTVLTTLGLENNLVGNTWGGAHTATAGTGASFLGNATVDGNPVNGAKVENASWMNEAWIAATAGKTTVKLGRMELDTPLAFTEKWSVEKNTFEAAVAINTDIPDTTLVGAYIGNGNGNQVPPVSGQNLQSNTQTLGLTRGAVVNANGEFGTYGTDGAYAVGAINNSFKPLTLQAWYYDVQNVVQAYWLQADLVCGKIPGLLAGAQYSGHELGYKPAAGAVNGVTSDVYAFMLGYEMKDTFTAKVAYSAVGDDFAAGFNTATATRQSKLYTETFWGGNFGNVTREGAESMKLSVTTPANGIADFGVSYVSVEHAAVNSDFQEIAVTASKSFGPLDATVAYVNSDNSVDDSNALIAFLKVNF